MNQNNKRFELLKAFWNAKDWRTSGGLGLMALNLTLYLQKKINT